VVIGALRASGSRDIRDVDYDLLGSLNTDPPQHFFISLAAGRLTELGGPAAVFILPPDRTPVRTTYLPHAAK
jgi:hypothetical protein